MPQTQLFLARTQVHIIEEVTVDTYVAPAGDGSNMVLVENFSIGGEGDNYVPKYLRGDYMGSDETPGSLVRTFSFRVPVAGGGSSGGDVLKPQCSKLIQACGFLETEIGAAPITEYTYTPRSVFDGAGGNPAQSYSMSVLVDGTRHALKGGFGTITIEGDNQNIVAFNFQMTGAYVAYADDGLESPTYGASVAPPYRGAATAVDFGTPYTPKGVSTFSIDLGNQVVIGRDANEASGIYGARITGKGASGSLSCEDVLQATHDWDGIQRAGTPGTFTTGLIGSTLGNRFTISCSRIFLRPIQHEEADGIMRVTAPFGIAAPLNADEATAPDMTISFT